MPKIYTITEAIQEIRDYHDQSSVRPFLIGVYGPGQDMGKSYFCKQAVDTLSEKYRPTASVSTHWELNRKQHLDVLDQLEYLFFDVGFNHPQPNRTFTIRAWDLQLSNHKPQNVSRKSWHTDLDVLLYNPNILPTEQVTVGLANWLKDFDLVVCNEYSRRKRH